MVNTNADIILIAILIVGGSTMFALIAYMIRSHYREMRKLEAQEARENEARLAKIREKNRIKLAEELERVEADRKARAAEPRIPHLPPGEKLIFGDGHAVEMNEIMKLPTAPPVGVTSREDAARQARYREEHEVRRRDRLRREDEEAARARRRQEYDSPLFVPSFHSSPQFDSPSVPSKPESPAFEPGGGTSGGGGASASWDSGSSSSDSSSSSSSSSSDSGSSSSSSD